MNPELQILQGCFKPADRDVTELGGFVFNRCPVTYQDKASLLLLRNAEDNFLERVGIERAYKLPAKKYQALRYLADYLLKLRSKNV